MKLIFEETSKGQPVLLLFLFVPGLSGQRKAELYWAFSSNPEETHGLIWPILLKAGGKRRGG